MATDALQFHMPRLPQAVQGAFTATHARAHPALYVSMGGSQCSYVMVSTLVAKFLSARLLPLPGEGGVIEKASQNFRVW